MVNKYIDINSKDPKLAQLATMARPHKVDKYHEFIMWFAMPTLEREKLGIETQTAFSEYYGVSRETLSRWKNRPDFEPRVDHVQQEWGKERTGDVVMGIYRSAVKGNPMSQLLWLQYFKKFTPKTQVEHTAKVEIGVNDIRFLIEGLPTQELKDEHYNNLRKLLDDAQQARTAGLLEDGDRTDGFTEDVQGQADNDAQDVSGTDADGVPESYTPSVRAHMVWEVHSNHYQGTPWRRQE